MPETPRRWLSVAEAASYLGISEGGMRSAIASGKLPASKVSGVGIRVDRRKLDEILEQAETPAVSAGGWR